MLKVSLLEKEEKKKSVLFSAINFERDFLIQFINAKRFYKRIIKS